MSVSTVMDAKTTTVFLCLVDAATQSQMAVVPGVQSVGSVSIQLADSVDTFAWRSADREGIDSTLTTNFWGRISHDSNSIAVAMKTAFQRLLEPQKVADDLKEELDDLIQHFPADSVESDSDRMPDVCSRSQLAAVQRSERGARCSIGFIGLSRCGKSASQAMLFQDYEPLSRLSLDLNAPDNHCDVEFYRGGHPGGVAGEDAIADVHGHVREWCSIFAPRNGIPQKDIDQLVMVEWGDGTTSFVGGSQSPSSLSTCGPWQRKRRMNCQPHVFGMTSDLEFGIRFQMMIESNLSSAKVFEMVSASASGSAGGRCCNASIGGPIPIHRESYEHCMFSGSMSNCSPCGGSGGSCGGSCGSCGSCGGSCGSCGSSGSCGGSCGSYGSSGSCGGSCGSYGSSGSCGGSCGSCGSSGSCGGSCGSCDSGGSCGGSCGSYGSSGSCGGSCGSYGSSGSCGGSCGSYGSSGSCGSSFSSASRFTSASLSPGLCDPSGLPNQLTGASPVTGYDVSTARFFSVNSFNSLISVTSATSLVRVCEAPAARNLDKKVYLNV
jgi:hypothetical protein